MRKLEQQVASHCQHNEAGRAATEQLHSKFDELRALLLAGFSDLKAHLHRHVPPSAPPALPPALTPSPAHMSSVSQITVDQQSRALANKEAALARRQAAVGGGAAPHAAPLAHALPPTPHVGTLAVAAGAPAPPAPLPLTYTTPMHAVAPPPPALDAPPTGFNQPLAFAGFHPPWVGAPTGTPPVGDGLDAKLTHEAQLRAHASREAALRRREAREQQLQHSGGAVAAVLGELGGDTTATPACLGRSAHSTARSFKAPRRMTPY